MFRNYFLVAIRSLLRNKFYAMINIGGLGIAMAMSVVGYVNYQFSESFDSFHQKAERIYTINTIQDDNGEEAKSFYCPTPLAPAVADELPGVENFSRRNMTLGTMRFQDQVFSEDFSFVDYGFTEMFTLEVVAGEMTSFADPQTIIIADDVAVKYFGDQDPIGQQVTLTFGAQGEHDFVVGAVIAEMPLNSCLYESILIPYARQIDILGENHQSWADWTQTAFVQLAAGAEVAEVEQHLSTYLPPTNQSQESEVERFYMVPLKQVAADAREVSGSLRDGMHPAAIVAPSVTALLVLLLACFNFMNTSIAFASRRVREIGVRKVIGSRRSQLVWQSLGENLLVCAASLVLAAVLAEIFVPAYDSLWPELSLAMNYGEDPGLVSFMLGMLLFTGLAAGAYPAFYVSGLKPAAILAGKQRLRGTTPLTRILLTMQLALSMVTITSALIMAKNADYIANFDPGYNPHGVLVIPFPHEGEYQVLKNEIEDDANIIRVAGSRQIMGRYLNGVNTEVAGEKGFALYFGIGEGYFETAGLSLAAGRTLDPSLAADVDEAILVNETMVKRHGWSSGIDRRLKMTLADSTREYRVVGVVHDFQANGINLEVRPTILRLSTPDRYRFISIKCDPQNQVAAGQYVEATWKRLFPHRPYTSFWHDEVNAGEVQTNDAIRLVFLYIAMVTLVISVMGLFALVSLSIAGRTKEIGIRKILGADVSGLSLLVGREFLVLMAVGSGLASVMSYFLVDALLSSIWTYYCDFGIMPFVSAALVVLVAAILSVGYRVYAAATANPVEALRYE